MDKKRLIALSAAVAGSVALWNCDKDNTVFGPQDVKRFSGSVSGRVQDQRGRPVPGAMVTVYPGGVTTVSGDSGKFEIGNMAPGAYRFALSKADYRDTARQDSVLVGMLEDKRVDSLRLAYRFATVKGSVDLAGTGTQFPGVVVEDQDVSTTVSPTGKFTLGRIEPGHVRLFAACQGVGYGVHELDLTAGDTVGSLSLSIDHRGGTVSGTVVDTAGRAIAGAKVSSAGGQLSTGTDLNGRFSLPNVPPSAMVRVASGNLATTLTGLVVPEGGLATVSTVQLGQARPAGRLPVPQDGIALGTISDSLIYLVARDSAATDTSWHVRRWLWTSGSGWKDSSSTNVLPVKPSKMGWTAGSTGTVQVRERIYRISGGVVTDSTTSSATITVRIAPPPDRTPPTLRKASPSKDTAVSNPVRSLLVSWTVSDNRRLDSVWVDSVWARVDSGKVSKLASLEVGRNVVRVVARDSAGNANWDSLVVTRAAAPVARDSRLDSLSVIPGQLSPSFHRDTSQYRDTVESTDSFVVVRAQAADSLAVVRVDGKSSNGGADTVKLAAAGSSTTIPIRVAAGMDTATYELMVWRKARAVGADTMGLPGLVAYYSFDGNAKDGSGNGNDGVAAGTSSDLDRFGRPTGALLFDAKASKVSVAKRSGFAFNGPLSIASWLRRGPSRGQESIVNSWYDGTEPDRGVVLEFKGDSIRFNLASDGTGPSAPDSRFADDRWHFVVASWDGGKMSLWIDDSLASIAVHSGALTDQSESLGIGCDPNTGSGVGSFFDGSLDDIRIYNRALTATEIEKLYREGGWTGSVPVDPLPTLRSLSVDSSVLRPAFDSLQTTYFDTVAAGVATVTVRALAAKSSSSVEIDGRYIVRSSMPGAGGAQYPPADSAIIAVPVPTDTTIHVKVYHYLDSTRARTYTIRVVHRAASQDTLGIPGLVAYYPFNGDAKDGSGNGNDGTVNGATRASDRFGAGGNAYSFDGTSNYIKVPDADLLDVGPQMAISAWMLQQSNAPMSVVSKWADMSSNDRSFIVNVSSDAIQFATATASSQLDGSVQSLGKVSSLVNQPGWKHVVTTYDGSKKRVFLNGQEIASGDFSGTLFKGVADLGIGAMLRGSGVVEYFFNGSIDDIRIYNRALDSTEIRKLYHEGGWTGSNSTDTLTTLRSLAVDTSVGKLSTKFDSTVTGYTDTVAAGTSKVVLWPTASSASDTIKVNGKVVKSGAADTVELAKDTATVIVVVSNPNTTRTTTYNVFVVRRAPYDSAFGIPWNSGITYGTLTDTRDGKVYKTIQIGSQRWMAQNLNYRNTTGNVDSVGLLYSNSVDSGAKYGRSYTWAEAMAGQTASATSPSGVQGICPAHWHVPSEAEWATLQAFVDPTNPAVGTKLKSGSGWLPNGSVSGGGTDDYGFRALPGGRWDGAGFQHVGSNGHWWSATEDNASYAQSRQMHYDNAMVDGSYSLKTDGMSLRCVEDPPDTLVTLHALVFDSALNVAPTFDSSVLDYVVTVAYGKTRVDVTPVSSSGRAAIQFRSYSGTTNLRIASNEPYTVDLARDSSFDLVVTNPNNPVSKTYMFNVVHPPAPPGIASITSSGGILVQDRPTHYTDTVPWGTSTVVLTAQGVGAILYNGSSLGTISLTSLPKTVFVSATSGTQSVTDTVEIVERPGVVVKSNFPTGTKFEHPYRVHLSVDTAVDTTGLTLHTTMDGSAPTAASVAITNGYAFTMGTPVRLRASAWRSGVQIGPEAIFDWSMDSSVYLFEGTDDTGGALYDTTAFARTVHLSGYSFRNDSATGTTYSLVPATPSIGSGTELKFTYDLNGTGYPATGFGFVTPWNPIDSNKGCDFRQLVSISITVRDTRTGVNLQPLRLELHGPSTDAANYALSNKGIAYGWDFTPTGAVQRLKFNISSADIPGWATESPSPITTILRELSTVQLREQCVDHSCTAESGVLEIDDLTFNFK